MHVKTKVVIYGSIIVETISIDSSSLKPTKIIDTIQYNNYLLIPQKESKVKKSLFLTHSIQETNLTKWS